MTRFLLIRHAAHDAIGNYLAGQRGGLHLNAAGRAQLAALVSALHDVRLTAVVSSPLERTRETAEPIARDHQLELDIAPGLVEFDVGDWTGRSLASLGGTTEYDRFNTWRSLTPAPAGELMIDVQNRAVRSLLDLHRRYRGGTVAVVAHGDVIRATLLYLLGIPIDFLHRLEISPARISVVDVDDDAVRVVQINGSGAAAGL